MHFNLSLLAMAAIVAPALAAKTWDVNIGANGQFSPQEIDIAPGDTVRWPNTDGGDHAIVETIAGPRGCINKPGGFNSGRLPKNQAYARIFPTAGTVNYKDGVGANCLTKDASGTIYIGPRTTGTGTQTRTQTGTRTFTRPNPSGTTTAAAPIPTHTNVANSLSGEKSVLLGLACFIGALAL
ncbi:hypothetical protein BG006_003685 [Podila minutissima]|uniref:Uncharacterized protein n=1 Tax=Podila minutissima TaxID=64525 RepID=A0A9P5VG25_9FUNG|nr:hypothetical protein BG006_003685 [Podila minutissima]